MECPFHLWHYPVELVIIFSVTVIFDTPVDTIFFGGFTNLLPVNIRFSAYYYSTLKTIFQHALRFERILGVVNTYFLPTISINRLYY